MTTGAAFIIIIITILFVIIAIQCINLRNLEVDMEFRDALIKKAAARATSLYEDGIRLARKLDEMQKEKGALNGKIKGLEVPKENQKNDCLTYVQKISNPNRYDNYDTFLDRAIDFIVTNSNAHREKCSTREDHHKFGSLVTITYQNLQLGVIDISYLGDHQLLTTQVFK